MAAVEFALNPSTSSFEGGVTLSLENLANGTYFVGASPFVELATYADPEGEPRVERLPAVISDGGQRMVFVSPPCNKSGAHDMMIQLSTGEMPVRGLLYYVDSPCVSPGTVWYNGQCLPCSNFEGSFCPGGTRFWPTREFWSPNERTPPTRCRTEGACPGSLGEDPAYPPLQSAVTGERVTARCSDAYSGEFCAVCAPGYFRDNGVCRSCGDSSGVGAELALVSIVLLVYAIVVAGALLFLSSRRLVSVVASIVLLQQLAMASRVVLSALTDAQSIDGLATVVRVAAVINFELETVRPGCSVPRISFLTLYIGTLVLMLLCLVVLLLAVGIRAAYTVAASTTAERKMAEVRYPAYGIANVGIEMAGSDSGSDSDSEYAEADQDDSGSSGSSGSSVIESGSRSESEQEQEEQEEQEVGGDGNRNEQRDGEEEESVSAVALTRNRLIHTCIIMATLFYMQLTIRSIQAVHCITVGDGSSRLAVELTQECYVGGHKTVGALAWIMVVGYCALVPLAVLVLSQKMGGLSFTILYERFGILVRGLRPQRRWYRGVQYIVVFAFAAEVATISDSGFRVFASAINFGVSIILVAAADPFIETWQTALAYMVGTVSCSQVLVILYLNEEDLLFFIAFGVVFLVLCFAVGMVYVHRANRLLRVGVRPVHDEILAGSEEEVDDGELDEEDVVVDLDAFVNTSFGMHNRSGPSGDSSELVASWDSNRSSFLGSYRSPSRPRVPSGLRSSPIMTTRGSTGGSTVVSPLGSPVKKSANGVFDEDDATLLKRVSSQNNVLTPPGGGMYESSRRPYDAVATLANKMADRAMVRRASIHTPTSKAWRGKGKKERRRSSIRGGGRSDVEESGDGTVTGEGSSPGRIKIGEGSSPGRIKIKRRMTRKGSVVRSQTKTELGAGNGDRRLAGQIAWLDQKGLKLNASSPSLPTRRPGGPSPDISPIRKVLRRGRSERKVGGGDDQGKGGGRKKKRRHRGSFVSGRRDSIARGDSLGRSDSNVMQSSLK